jgi:asparagine synthase (glutamine-hydrolysing)
MCGIAGVFRRTPEAPPIDAASLTRASESLASRGPDGRGEWTSASGAVAFAHRRLAIIDLSPSAAQPMLSEDGRCSLVFNGEIYNYRELRAELLSDGERLRTSSDSEAILVLLARAARRGASIEDALGRLRGMYALAFWDESRRGLVLARDPFGIKPLYVSDEGDTLRFASQVRALEAPGVGGPLDPAGVAGFLLWGAVPEPFTLRRAIRSIAAGHALSVDARGSVQRPIPLPSLEAPPSADALGEAREALDDSVRAHLVSDVPVGVFLSAGLDSSLVAALARRHAGALRAVSVGFEAFAGTRDDELPQAVETARVLGLEAVTRRFSDRELRDARPQALAAMDQPSVDGFNTWLVSRAAREAGLKVVLSGLGGDELFGSYPSFRQVPRIARWSRRGRAIPLLERLLGAVGRGTGRPKLAGLLSHSGLAGAYFLRRGLFLPEELPGLVGPELAAEGLAAYDPFRDAERFTDPDAWVAVQRLESGLYLRNQLLRDVDWASMAHSLELRTPLVDAWLSARLARTGFEPARTSGKAALVRALAPELPARVFDRPKRGFALPTAAGPGGARAGLRSRSLALSLLEASGVPLRVTVPA